MSIIVEDPPRIELQMREEWRSLEQQEQTDFFATRHTQIDFFCNPLRCMPNNNSNSNNSDIDMDVETVRHDNSSKNRYYDITAMDLTRVRLEVDDPISQSDYINANFINGEVHNSEHYYIACQAPLEHTMQDFWQMIWEQNCGVIVMLTALVEDGVHKADAYWPSEEGKPRRFGKYVVRMTKSFQLGELTVRSFLLRKSTGLNVSDDRSSMTSSAGRSTREIIHIQYEHWPDFGVPESGTKGIRDLMVLATKFKERAAVTHGLDGPLVCHCSAGVGRTGTFIACHISLERLRHSQAVNIHCTVQELRKQRNKMVKNEHQYSLIYSVILDCLRTNILKELNSDRKVLSNSGNRLIPPFPNEEENSDNSETIEVNRHLYQQQQPQPQPQSQSHQRPLLRPQLQRPLQQQQQQHNTLQLPLSPEQQFGFSPLPAQHTPTAPLFFQHSHSHSHSPSYTAQYLQ